jgi:hypothetical protein
VAVVAAMSGWRELFRKTTQRAAGAALLWWLPLAFIALWMYRDLYSGRTAPSETNHSVMSFNMAVDAVYCGTPSVLSYRYSAGDYLAQNPLLTATPIVDVLARQAGSLAEYCRTATQATIVNDNSLMWLMRLAMWLAPGISFDGVGRFLGAIAVAMVLVFAFALLYAGASFAVSLAATLAACAVLRSLGLRVELYPFVLALPLFAAGLYVSAYCSRRTRTLHVTFLLASAAVMGVVVAFSTIMRTILLPSLTIMFGIFVFATLRRANARSRANLYKVAAGMLVAYAIGFGVYTATFVRPPKATRDASGSQYVYHTFAHPLVLGLGVPKNDFSSREGIAWNDDLGIVFARKAIPDAVYLGATYERALLQYYWGLWREHPSDMARVYALKLWSTSSGVFLSAAGIGRQFLLPESPWRWLNRVTSGPALFVLVIAVFVFSIRRYLATDDARMLLLAFVTVTAFSSLVEGFLTYSQFQERMFSPLLFFVCLSAVFGVESVAGIWNRRHAGWLARMEATPLKALRSMRVAEPLRVAGVLVLGAWWGGILAGSIVAAAYLVTRVAVRPMLALVATLAFAMAATPSLDSPNIAPPIALTVPAIGFSRVVAQGLSVEHDEALSIAPASYQLGPLDEQHVTIGELVATFPADMLIRLYAAAIRVTTVPFTPILRPAVPIAVLLAMAAAYADRRRGAFVAIALLVALAGISGLSFNPDRYASLEILPWLAIAMLLERTLADGRAPFEMQRTLVFTAVAIACVTVSLVVLRLYQRDPVRRMVRSFATTPKIEMPLRDTKGALYAVPAPAPGQTRVLEIDVNRWACADHTRIDFLYDRSQPAANFSRQVSVPGSSATHAVVRVLEPIASPTFLGVLLPQAAGCAQSLGWHDAARTGPVPEVLLAPEWTQTPMYQRIDFEAGLFR